MPPKQATRRKKPLKMLLYGPSGAGKTHFALFATPGKTLVFDMEGGTDLFEGRVDFDYWTDDEGYKTQSYRELRACIDYLKSPEGRKKYDSFILDPVTLIWTLLQQERQDYKEEKILQKRKGVVKENETDLETFTTRDWNIVKKMHKGIIDEVSALPQNLFLVAREKPVVIMQNGEPVQTGEITFEGEKNTIYAVDFAFRIWVDMKSQKRYCQIAKDRSGHYATGHVIESPTFELFNGIVNDMAGAEDAKEVKTHGESLFSNEGQEAISLNSIKALHAIRNDMGKTEDEFKAGLSKLLKREIVSLKDITETEAQKLIKYLNKTRAKEGETKKEVTVA